SLLTNVTVVPGAMLSWAGSKAWLLISTVIVFVAGTVVEFCTSVVFVSVVFVVFWLGSWPFGTLWATAMAANTSTAIAESAITYIRRFIRSPLVHTRITACSSIAYRITPLRDLPPHKSLGGVIRCPPQVPQRNNTVEFRAQDEPLL